MKLYEYPRYRQGSPTPRPLRGANIGCADPLRGANIGCADPLRGANIGCADVPPHCDGQ
jgi:hypothetical protein